MRYPAGESRGPPAEGLERHRSSCCFLVERSDQPPRRASDIALRGRAEIRGVSSEDNEVLHACTFVCLAEAIL
eukprot:6806350-Pyramimonas_sp.AAC.1